MPRPPSGTQRLCGWEQFFGHGGAEQDIANNAEIKHALFMTDYLWGRSAQSVQA
jgi:hypothetical protein